MPIPTILPRGTGTNRKGFNKFLSDIGKHYNKAFEEVYIEETEKIIKAIIDTTPIDTGAAAGVDSNKVGSEKRTLYKGHKAFPGVVGNLPGNTGWQLQVKQTRRTLDIAIVNPQWNKYLKYLEYGVVKPILPAKSHFVRNAWKNHIVRRATLRKLIKRANS